MNEIIKNEIIDYVLLSLEFKLIDDIYRKRVSENTTINIGGYKEMGKIIIQVEAMFLKTLCEFGLFHSYFHYEFIFIKNCFDEQMKEIIEKIKKIARAIGV